MKHPPHAPTSKSRLNKTFHMLWLSTGASILPLSAAMAEQNQTILTQNIIELREAVSPQGFVHPGISCNAATLGVMREKVIAGVSPWVDYFEGMRRTRFADPNRKPARVRQIVNDGGITGIAFTTGAWTHVAVTRSGNTVSLCVNGSLAGPGTIALSPSDLGVTTLNYLGKSQLNNPYLNAALDDFRIYSQAMNASEITALAAATTP